MRNAYEIISIQSEGETPLPGNRDRWYINMTNIIGIQLNILLLNYNVPENSRKTYLVGYSIVSWFKWYISLKIVATKGWSKCPRTFKHQWQLIRLQGSFPIKFENCTFLLKSTQFYLISARRTLDPHFYSGN